MKKLILFLFVCLTAVNLYSQATLHTPNGKSFQTYNADWQGSYNSDDFEALKTNLFGPGKTYPNSYVLGSWEDGIWEYNCHVFAWNNWQGADRWNSQSDMWKLGKPSPYALYWKDYPNVWYTDSDNPIGIVSYTETSNQSEASIVTYQLSGGITHSARIVGDGTRYISKWGSSPVVNHPPTEVPTGYGSIYSRYKINPAYRPVGAGDLVGRNWQTISNALNGIPSGSLVSVLSGTQTLAGNISVPSGVTLTIKSDATTNLNGYYIASTGGTITIESGVTINSALLKTGSTIINGIYPTLQLALSNASSGQVIELWGASALQGNVSVPTGVTLTITSGATINLNGYSIVSTGGSINVQSGANVRGAQLRNLNPAIIGLYPTIQTAVNAATGNQMIVISGGTFNEDVTAMYKDNLNISGSGNYYTTIAGSLTFSSCDNLVLQAFECNGATLIGCYFATVSCSIYGNPSQRCLSLFQCTDFAYYGNSYNGASGLLAITSNGEIVASFDNNLTSVTSSTYSNVCAVGTRFCTSVNWDLSAVQFSYLNAYECYYRDGFARRCSTRGGTVYVGGQYNCTSLPKSGSSTMMSKELTSSIQSQSDDLAQVEFSNVNNSYFGLLRTIKEEAKKNGLSKNSQLHAEYLPVLKEFKTFIKNNPQSPLAGVALTTAANSYGIFGDYEEMKSLLNEIMSNGELAQLKNVARSLMVDYYRKTKDYDGAISAADAFVKDCKGDSELVADVMFKKGLVLYYDKKMPGDAATCFSMIVKNYPSTEVASLAQNLLQSIEGQVNERADSTGIVADQGIIIENYPNPFNPSTTIRYQLPNAGHVMLKVYDMLGREVATLVNGMKETGYYSAIFDGARLASGIYIMRLTVQSEEGKSFTQTKKIMLLK